NQSQVAQLEQKFVENHALDFRTLDLPVNAVATALKNFFSALAEPVIPYALYNDLIAATGAEEHKLGAIRRVLDRLPAENRQVLRYLIGHMRHVADNAHLTAMDLRNLAKCWWPTLLRPHFDSFESMAGLTPRLEEFAQLLLQNSDLLLSGSVVEQRSGDRK
uniref:Rho-GAP domain-containing protein n=1 Tax=Plectus sambesii TaxID=2011161 RepID=A0A914X1M1_9BILA